MGVLRSKWGDYPPGTGDTEGCDATQREHLQGALDVDLGLQAKLLPN